jgi:5'-nucleotidase
MIEKQTIGIDLDDTLNNLVDVWLEHYCKDYDDDIKKEDIHSWDITSYVKLEAKSSFFNYLSQPDFFKLLGIQPYAQEVIKWLSEYFNLYIVTAYYHLACKDKAEYIIKNFPSINPKNIIFCNDKGLINTDYLIDDGKHNLEAFNGIGLLYDKPWNRDYTTDLRFTDWLEIKEYFKNIIKNELYKNKVR